MTADDLARDALAARAGDLGEHGLAHRRRGSPRARAVPGPGLAAARPLARRRGRPMPLPLEPNTAWDDGARAALWLGPDEWLVLGPPRHRPATWSPSSRRRSTGCIARSSTSARTAWRSCSAGPTALEMLASGCSLDLHPRSWRDGHVRADAVRARPRSSCRNAATRRACSCGLPSRGTRSSGCWPGRRSCPTASAG